MACYISSNDNRFYVSEEQTYGEVASISALNRIPAIRLRVNQVLQQPNRRDKTGGRTFTGLPSGLRRRTEWSLETYLKTWSDTAAPPAYGALFQAALGGTPQMSTGGILSSASDRTIRFAGSHGLTAGQAISLGGELRFVTAIIDSQSVLVNAPFTVWVAPGMAFEPTVTYMPATQLRSVSVFDYWSPETSVQRIVTGAAVNDLAIRVNGDYHGFQFGGLAADLVDNVSFESGQGSLTQFPIEPEVTEPAYSVVPGHLGQAWMGSTAERVWTITEAEIAINNGIDLREREFGMDRPRCISAGSRTVRAQISLFEQDNEHIRSLYQAAKQHSPIEVMFQLGIQSTQLCGVYLKSVVPDIPEFDDTDTRLQWRFTDSRAQGTFNDEISIAFA
ncbi:MAG: hypothetical protein HUU41_08810 [Bryobacteraceae bacterium]|nr:hypothetical protein [Bryobacterales bacterium]MEB2360438.1 hypothetical protein [Bryobacterales bacterium]NUN01200.1 hypothetical protein [Bryobacteraceae bacterium]